MIRNSNDSIPSPPFQLRRGISVIEVLTSIVVAMIGVFGVLAMIPFAVQQTQSGLDRDGATVLARNGMAEMEIRGYRAPENWIEGAGDPVNPDTDATELKPYSIDPLAVLENGGDYTTTGFPFTDSGATLPFPATYTISPASLVSGGTGADMLLSDARRMFRGKNELNTGQLTDEMIGPNPLFDANAATDVARRQTVGSLSWSVLMVPFKPIAAAVGNAWSYRSYVIVYKDRVYDPTTADGQNFSTAVNQDAMDPNGTIGVASPVGTIHLQANTFPADYPFAKGDWVMLINRQASVADGGTVENGFEYQVAFYRMVNYTSDATNTFLESVTLDGPDFNFGDPTDTTNWDANGTHFVHLRGVVAVYERDIVHEELSTWNLDR